MSEQRREYQQYRKDKDGKLVIADAYDEPLTIWLDDIVLRGLDELAAKLTEERQPISGPITRQEAFEACWAEGFAALYRDKVKR